MPIHSYTRQDLIDRFGEECTGPERVYDVPKVFYQDHVERDLPTGVLVKEYKGFYRLSMTEGEATELISDADYYSTEWTQMGIEMFGLGMSAKATKTRMVHQMLAYGYQFHEKQIRMWGLHRIIAEWQAKNGGQA